LIACHREYNGPDHDISLIFTRDFGHHTSGWWKNPDYEHCLHLSLGFIDRAVNRNLPRDECLSSEWCRLFFGDLVRFIWAEPPYTAIGKAIDIWHYRVFTAPDYELPVLPRGEVYSREMTERGWLSYSDLKYERWQAPIDESGAD